jgi:acyl-CoA synthetase (AMP-forming)/AMP-acid ligase II
MKKHSKGQGDKETCPLHCSSLTKEAVISYYRERVATYKVPEVEFIQQLPKNALGKVLKRELRNSSN